MIFRSNGENVTIMTKVCKERKQIHRIIVQDFKLNTKYLPGQKFYSSDNRTLNTGQTKCFDIAQKDLLVQDY